MDEDDGPAGPNANLALLKITQATAELTANLALILAREGILIGRYSEQAEEAVRKIGEGARVGGGQIAETIFSDMADEMANLRKL